MILLGLGFLFISLSVFFFIKGGRLGNKKVAGWICDITGGIIIVVAFVTLLGGFLVPFGGYEEPKLISIHEATSVSYEEQDVYVMNDGEIFICYEKVEVITADGREYKMNPKILSEGMVQIIPEKDCQMPRIEEYLAKGKSSFLWSIAKENDKTEYKVYVPEGTILETED